MNNMDNLKSYDKVEYIQAYEFSDRDLLQYCNLKMETAQDNADFIVENIFGKGLYRGGADVCEIGGGNGKLLLGLEKRGLLKSGINYEISKSRCDLAVKFAELLSSKNVKTRNCNFLDDDAQMDAFDCIVMVDIVWQLISPLYDTAENEMLEWIRKALRTGGHLFIEMVDYSDVIKRIEKDGKLHTWIEFPEGDPYQYSLDKFSVDKDNNLVCEKKFIGRDNDVRDYFKNVIRSYKRGEIEKILVENGFRATFYKVCNDSLNETERNNTFRILAQKL